MSRETGPGGQCRRQARPTQRIPAHRHDPHPDWGVRDRYSIVGAVYFALKGLGLERIRGERSFDLLILQGTIVLPLSASVFYQAGRFRPAQLFQLWPGDIGPFYRAPGIGGHRYRPLVAPARFGWPAWHFLVDLCRPLQLQFFTNGLGIPMGLVAALGTGWRSSRFNAAVSLSIIMLCCKSLLTNSWPAIGLLIAIFHRHPPQAVAGLARFSLPAC